MLWSLHYLIIRRVFQFLVLLGRSDRAKEIEGVTTNPTGAWVAQQARNLLMDLGERAGQIRFVIRDRDSKFTGVFDAVFTSISARVIQTPVRAPRANAIAERWVGSVRRECTDRLLIYGERHLSAVLAEYQRHYNFHRPHRARNLRPPQPPPRPVASLDFDSVRLQRREVLNGLISQYERAA